MKAAVVSSFDTPPRYEEFPLPKAGCGQLVVDVLATAIHPLTRSLANGSHYSSGLQPPLVPGLDGVGRGSDGELRYFVLHDAPVGSMAQQAVIDEDRSVVLPKGADPVLIAAAMNPAMGSWLALRCRVPFKKKQNVLVLGATGSAGSMAVQVAKRLGAAQIIAAGRDEVLLQKLPSLGATTVVKLDDPRFGELCSEVDVVLDFIWGEPAAKAMTSLITQRKDRSRLLTWVEIGSMAGLTAPIPAAVLRAAQFQIVGSGIGSISGREILKELPSLVKELVNGEFVVDAKMIPLREVTRAWSDAEQSQQRIVLVP